MVARGSCTLRRLRAAARPPCAPVHHVPWHAVQLAPLVPESAQTAAFQLHEASIDCWTARRKCGCSWGVGPHMAPPALCLVALAGARSQGSPFVCLGGLPTQSARSGRAHPSLHMSTTMRCFRPCGTNGTQRAAVAVPLDSMRIPTQGIVGGAARGC